MFSYRLIPALDPVAAIVKTCGKQYIIKLFHAFYPWYRYQHITPYPAYQVLYKALFVATIYITKVHLERVVSTQSLVCILWSGMKPETFFYRYLSVIKNDSFGHTFAMGKGGYMTFQEGF